ncbi:MAG: phosphoglycerate kinase [Chlamydiia bacterium]|nr:phosphoglycerate kinase [Chlamydiia bacterium]
MTHKLSITDLDINSNTVLMRVDFNVPLDKKANITDATRIAESLRSIKYVLDKGGALILMSHLGRPKGKRVPEMSLAPCAQKLSEMLGKEVIMAPDCVGAEVEALARDLKPGQIMLLENLRFHRGEEHPDEDPNFAKQLAALGDLYVNDAFGTAHRKHASNVAITQYFPGKAAAGFLMEKEIRFLGAALLNPKRPFYAIIGGAKISSKIGVIKALLTKVDALFIGGGMAYTFLKAQGIEIGESIHEDDLIPEALGILEAAKKSNAKLFLPVDSLVAEKIEQGAPTQVAELTPGAGVPQGEMGVDIGPKTIEIFSQELRNAETLFWNGPLGIFEIGSFAKGTDKIAEVVAELQGTTIVGGGDSVAALQAGGYAGRISHISTGGGASLEYIEFGELPGIEALSESKASV